MSQEDVPEETGPQQSAPQPAAERKGAPKGLLQQMEELMASLNADLTQLDADLQSTTDRTPPADGPGEAQQAYGNEEREQHEDRENR
ncbi:hypothetical protein ACFV98_15260 [Streptomyces violascens]|uniref:hypothetical protein n=1 Tax=Streptomyces violascens TaxID=67381 RepID=UPI00364A37C1